MFAKTDKLLVVFFFSVMIFVLASCGDSGGKSPATSTFGSIAAKLDWDGSKIATKRVANAPVGVATVRFLISGPDMVTLQQDFPAINGSGTVNNVPTGSGMTITALGLNASGALIYQGTVSGVSVQPGQTTDVGTITMLMVVPTLTSVEVTPSNPTVSVGTVIQFTATGTYSDGSVKDLSSLVTWSSSNTSAATITNSGIATMMASDTTIITASSSAILGTTSLTATTGAIKIYW